MSSSWVVHVFVEPDRAGFLCFVVHAVDFVTALDNVCTKRADVGQKNVNEVDAGKKNA
jgi:hypothetical protein